MILGRQARLRRARRAVVHASMDFVALIMHLHSFISAQSFLKVVTTSWVEDMEEQHHHHTTRYLCILAKNTNYYLLEWPYAAECP